MTQNTNAPVHIQDLLYKYQPFLYETLLFNTFSMLRVHKEVVDAEISMEISFEVD